MKLPWGTGVQLWSSGIRNIFIVIMMAPRIASLDSLWLNKDTENASRIGGILVICVEQFSNNFIYVFQRSTYDLSSYPKLI